MENNDLINQITGKVSGAVPPALFDNWQTAFIWLVVAIVVFAFVLLFLNFKRLAKGQNVNKGALPFIKWPLLFASAGFNVFFTYYVFLPAGQTVALFAAVVMGGVNLAEAYLVRLIIATWRHDMKLVFRMALVFTIPVFMYSLMAAGSSFSTMMMKNKDSLAASQLELQAANDQIGAAQAEVKEAQIGANKGQLLQALYQTEVRNSRGVKVAFSDVKASCDSGGWYARNYPALCDQYQQTRNGTLNAANVAAAQTDALKTSAQQKIAMAKIIKDRPPEITPTLLGFALGIAAVGFIVSLALESAIIGVGFFEELFIKPTPLPAIVSFMNKALDWDANSITQRGLQVDIAPSPGAVNFSNNGAMSSPFSSVGWSPQNPKKLQNATVLKRTDTERNATVPNTPSHKQDGGNALENVSAERNATVPEHTPERNQSNITEQKAKLDLLVDIKQRLEAARTANIGDMIDCAYCGTETEKRIDTKRCCSAKCRKELYKLGLNKVIKKPQG